MKRSHRTPWLVAAVLAALISGSIAAPRALGWDTAITAANEDPIDGDLTPEESLSPDEGDDPDGSLPIDEGPTPDPGQDPGDNEEPDESPDPDATDGAEGSEETTESDMPEGPSAPTLTLGDLLAATSAGSPLDAALALAILRDYAPPGARAIEVADRQTFRNARTYSMREIRGWSRLPQLGTLGSIVWMRFVGGAERTPFAVAAGHDRSDPRITGVRAREGRATRGNPPPYLLTVKGSDTGTGAIAVEVRVGFERPLRFAASGEFEIGPFIKSNGGKVLLLMRGESVQIRLVDAAGNTSPWRSVRLP